MSLLISITQSFKNYFVLFVINGKASLFQYSGCNFLLMSLLSLLYNVLTCVIICTLSTCSDVVVLMPYTKSASVQLPSLVLTTQYITKPIEFLENELRRSSSLAYRETICKTFMQPTQPLHCRACNIPASSIFADHFMQQGPEG